MVGVGKVADKTEKTFVAGEWVTAEGFKFIVDEDALPYHNETLVLSLPDGTRIEYGARPVEGTTIEDNLSDAKMTLLQILSTYEALD